MQEILAIPDGSRVSHRRQPSPHAVLWRWKCHRQSRDIYLFIYKLPNTLIISEIIIKTKSKTLPLLMTRSKAKWLAHIFLNSTVGLQGCRKYFVLSEYERIENDSKLGTLNPFVISCENTIGNVNETVSAVSCWLQFCGKMSFYVAWEREKIDMVGRVSALFGSTDI